MKNNQNIFSDLNKDIGINKSIGIVRSLWNSEITTRLYDGCVNTLIKYGVKKEYIRTLEVPGSFELIYGANHLINSPSWETVEIERIDATGKTNKELAQSLDIDLGTIELDVNKRKILDAVIIIGSIIKGETPHFDFIAQSITKGAIDLNISSEIPVILCVSTDLNIDQAFERSGGKHSNKGIESALTALKLLQNIQADFTKHNPMEEDYEEDF